MMFDGEADDLHKYLSEPRFAPYLAACGGDSNGALRLYLWNIRISRAFFPLLHAAEVSLRNGLHDELVSFFGRRDWWSTAPLNPNGRAMVKRALERVAARRTSYNADDVVAELTLGFWVSLISKSYTHHLWVPALHRAFPRYHGTRDVLHKELQEVRELRNRVMHHEPIHRRDLAVDHATIHRLLDYLSSGLADAVDDDVLQILRDR